MKEIGKDLFAISLVPIVLMILKRYPLSLKLFMMLFKSWFLV